MFRPVWLLLAAVLCLSLEGCSNEAPRTVAAAGQVTGAASKSALPVSTGPSHQDPVQTSERRPFTILAGGDGLADDRLVDNLATALERNRRHLRLERSKGPQRDLLALLNNPGIDVAIIPTDAIESLPRQVRAGARDHLRYLFRVPSQRLHILARIDVTNIYDLNGRKVDIGEPGSGEYLTARLIFDKLGIKPEFTNSDQTTALQQLRSNAIQGVVLLASETSKEVLAFEPGGAYHLVPISFETIASPLGELIVHYAPSQITAEEYPNLVEQGRQLDTIAVSRVLALRNWPEGSAHYERLADFNESLSSYLFEQLQKSVDNGTNPAEQALNWNRFRPTEVLLARKAQQAEEHRAFEGFTVAQGACPLPDAAARERLYNDFLTWRKARDQDPSSAGSGPGKR
ncbi:TAXI family TRAP transporter solute-binding subunit [Microvirga yunnanensis]|uniref:TAXI family TRAP transporter solute-binding subunit n=1 Tax=Microvirga yunnanensis TaxID=2953740 RepID=UPI0021C7C10C|nr:MULTISPECIES: TAXI family TRAP transporter solute-binding subunit [unclassified Microvirga]